MQKLEPGCTCASYFQWTSEAEDGNYASVHFPQGVAGSFPGSDGSAYFQCCCWPVSRAVGISWLRRGFSKQNEASCCFPSKAPARLAIGNSLRSLWDRGWPPCPWAPPGASDHSLSLRLSEQVTPVSQAELLPWNATSLSLV